MAEYVTLLGAEEVARAAGRFQHAADTMSQAVSAMDFALERQQRFFHGEVIPQVEAWLERLEKAVAVTDDPSGDAEAEPVPPVADRLPDCIDCASGTETPKAQTIDFKCVACGRDSIIPF